MSLASESRPAVSLELAESLEVTTHHRHLLFAASELATAQRIGQSCQKPGGFPVAPRHHCLKLCFHVLRQLRGRVLRLAGSQHLVSCSIHHSTPKDSLELSPGMLLEVVPNRPGLPHHDSHVLHDLALELVVNLGRAVLDPGMQLVQRNHGLHSRLAEVGLVAFAVGGEATMV